MLLLLAPVQDFLVLPRLTVRIGKNCKQVTQAPLPCCTHWVSFLPSSQKFIYADKWSLLLAKISFFFSCQMQ